MSKRIAYCADGTWQSPVNNDNVYRLYKAMLVTSDQVTFYDDGVGADATGIARLLQGGTGDGLIQKVKDGYTRIAHVYEPGDQLYFFGWSRGAYTARSIAGMIASCGLPNGAFSDDCVDQVFTAYRNPSQRAAILAGLGSCGLADATITMIGVWDTVGSLGIPALFGGIDEAQYGFLDTNLHPDVQNAFHCVAIDEVRPQFPATLWTSTPAPGQTLEQVWFSGCHGDIGGGTALGAPVDSGTRLCDFTLQYMLLKAQALGLTFDPILATQLSTLNAESTQDRIQQTWAPTDGPQHLRPIPADALVANSVAMRIQYALTYLPGNLAIPGGALADTYNQVTVIDPTAI